MRHIRRGVLSAVILAAVATSLPAHAEDTGRDGWRLIGTTYAPTNAVDTTAIVAALNSALATATQSACKPRVSEIAVYSLGEDTWQSLDRLQTAYRWFGSGRASMSNDCASGVTLTVQITDIAPHGEPISQEAHASFAGGLGANTYTAMGTTRNEVLYYDLSRLYARGSSAIELKASATYTEKKTKLTKDIGCFVTYTPVKPTPYNPEYGATTDPENCATGRTT